MCSFLFTNKKINDIEKINFYQKFRGPDLTTSIQYNNFSFIHNLLQITGDFVNQPFIENDIVCLYNGEIYNYKDFGDFKSDGPCLIPLYNEYGVNFIKKIDGEFAIILIDFKNNLLIISSDIFRTKPIFYSIENNNIGVSSYSSALKLLNFNNIKMVKPNTTLILNLKTFELINKKKIFNFDIEQHKNDYFDWINAFELSIKKRTTNLNKKCFLGLSSGYDSGAIACELNKIDNFSFKAFTILGPENKKIIEQRKNIIKDLIEIHLTFKEYSELQKYINKFGDNFSYGDKYIKYDYKKDKASIGLAKICKEARKENNIVYFSGQGADEILSDYGFNGNKFYNHSSFGGKFPKKLNGFFPWHSFFDGTQIQYLNKEEYVSGIYGIETRYPFLDKDLVQEFLWLTSNLKNKYYKAPLREYFIKNNFPFDENTKIGFNCLKGLK